MVLIRKNALKFILNASKRTYPREFIGLLRGGPDIIEEILLIPRSLFGDNFSVIEFNMKPIDPSIIGSVHSHPSHSYEPSDADLRFFRKMGFIHLILKYPYQSIEDIATYDMNGNRLPLHVLEDVVNIKKDDDPRNPWK
ncbi:MAG: hypothetical protein DRO90_01785 [Candidatus Altiarchaeales archaeon]|nr:MAG: hypothetical protein DRO95_03575 [Candidatus Altiarchaeales archaeon]RLI93486.1 MAG: hypothetical protein DRO94_05095 [Candidatus Altiarchaeales archaeon]RLI94590.1 MAG: hypothetical protein DRO90_01785 [Candidatus Altiarchaeales archaeon]HDO82784.1 hypothetical protein [Candidatus Altiarchaeales archaeon]HEX55433.1 hypothetical protein [Candidatus Altiarchaeales archaeon]